MVTSIVSVVVHIALFVGGLVLSLGLRRRDPRAAVLVAVGFGCEILVSLTGVVQGFVMSSFASGGIAAMMGVSTVFTLVNALIRIAGLALIFFGLLRVMRGLPAAGQVPPAPPGPPGGYGPYGPAGVNR